jgi:hypothetical protein
MTPWLVRMACPTLVVIALLTWPPDEEQGQDQEVPRSPGVLGRQLEPAEDALLASKVGSE